MEPADPQRGRARARLNDEITLLKDHLASLAQFALVNRHRWPGEAEFRRALEGARAALLVYGGDSESAERAVAAIDKELGKHA